MILELPQGYDTLVGQGGINLSGGQKQLIALARAMYGSPWIMVMDEPDSHLDQSGRDALKRLFINLKEKGVSLVVISHNHDVAQVADKSMILDKGRLMQGGMVEGEMKAIEDKG